MAAEPSGERVLEQEDVLAGESTSQTAVHPELVPLPAVLGELMGRNDMPKIRKAPGKKLYSLADVGGAILNKTPHDACRDLRIVTEKFPDLGQSLSLVRFTAKRRQPVDVAVGELALIIEYIFYSHLPSY